jgi:hypothetical protein
LIRHKIIDCFRGTDFDAGPDAVAERLGLETSALLALLRSESSLDDLAGLRLSEAKRVLKHFAGMAVFTPAIEKAVSDYDEARDKIREFEKQARSDD